MKNTVISAGCFVLMMLQFIEASSSCSKEIIDPLWQKCDKTYFVSSANNLASMKKICKNVECLVKCKTNAVGDCANREEFREHLFMYDPEKWKVNYRLICSNVAAAAQQFSGRCTANEICSQGNIPYFNQNEKDKKVLCSSLDALRKCVSISPDPAKKCTADGAKLQEDIRKLGYSVSICENTDIKELYRKYGGPDKCGSTSGTARVEFSLAAIIMTMFYWSVSNFR